MKVLMIGSGSYRSSLSFRLVALGKEFAKSGVTVTMVLPAADKYNNFTADRHATIPGVTLMQPWQPATKSNIINLLPYLITALIAVIRARPDLIYLYKPTPISIIGFVPKLLFQVPVVVDIDDLGSEVMRQQGQASFEVRLVDLSERIAIKLSTAIIVTSTYLASLTAERYPDKHVAVIPNGVDMHDYPVTARTSPRNAIYYFGVLNRLELIATLLEALPPVLTALPDTSVTIAGGGTALNDAKQLARKLGIEAHVRFTGWIEQAAIRSYVKFADIAVSCQPDIPTVKAASLMKSFQYMALSSVAVVSDVGDMATYFANGRAGIIIPPNDTKRLSDTLIALLNDPERRTKLAIAARDRVAHTYTWQIHAKNILQFIERTTGLLQEKHL